MKIITYFKFDVGRHLKSTAKRKTCGRTTCTKTLNVALQSQQISHVDYIAHGSYNI